MTTSNVSQIIQDLSIDNFRLYPEQYPLTQDGLATDEATENIQDLAKYYFDVRNEDEIERDNNLGIDLTDYVEYCMSAFSSFLLRY
jgi:hypothetical protein